MTLGLLHISIRKTKVGLNFGRSEDVTFKCQFTRRTPLRTEMPLTLSTDKSTNDAITMMRSNMFHPLQKYSLLSAINFKQASRVKKEVNTCKDKIGQY